MEPWLLGQAVKTPPFHGGNTGSSPVGVIQTEVKYRFCFFITYLLLRKVVRAGRRSTPGKCVGVTSVSRVRIPYLPLFSYPSLNLVKQNVDLTGICYITLSFDLYRRRILTFPKRSQDMLILYITSPKINLTFPSYFPMHRALFLFLFVRFHLINENKHP